MSMNQQGLKYALKLRLMKIIYIETQTNKSLRNTVLARLTHCADLGVWKEKHWRWITDVKSAVTPFQECENKWKLRWTI